MLLLLSVCHWPYPFTCFMFFACCAALPREFQSSLHALCALHWLDEHLSSSVTEPCYSSCCLQRKITIKFKSDKETKKGKCEGKHRRENDRKKKIKCPNLSHCRIMTKWRVGKGQSQSLRLGGTVQIIQLCEHPDHSTLDLLVLPFGVPQPLAKK